VVWYTTKQPGAQRAEEGAQQGRRLPHHQEQDHARDEHAMYAPFSEDIVVYESHTA